MEPNVGDLVVIRPGGGLIMQALKRGHDGLLYCVSIDTRGVIKDWFDPKTLKKVVRPRAIVPTF